MTTKTKVAISGGGPTGLLLGSGAPRGLMTVGVAPHTVPAATGRGR